MKALIETLASMRTGEETAKPPLLHVRSGILDMLIREARRVKPAVVVLTADGNIQVDNPSGLPLSIRDYETADNADVDLEDFGESARLDKDNSWYIERGNQ